MMGSSEEVLAIKWVILHGLDIKKLRFKGGKTMDFGLTWTRDEWNFMIKDEFKAIGEELLFYSWTDNCAETSLRDRTWTRKHTIYRLLLAGLEISRNGEVVICEVQDPLSRKYTSERMVILLQEHIVYKGLTQKTNIGLSYSWSGRPVGATCLVYVNLVSFGWSMKPTKEYMVLVLALAIFKKKAQNVSDTQVVFVSKNQIMLPTSAFLDPFV